MQSGSTHRYRACVRSGSQITPLLFFSSRRRHTRLQGDWSSDVCSSDLSRYGISRADQDAFAAESQRRAARAIADGSFAAEIVGVDVPQKKGDPLRVATDEYRSEERRVG